MKYKQLDRYLTQPLLAAVEPLGMQSMLCRYVRISAGREASAAATGLVEGEADAKGPILSPEWTRFATFQF